MQRSFLFLLAMILSGCSGPSSSPPHHNAKGEYIYRKHGEKMIEIEPMRSVERNPYPWEIVDQG